MKQILVRKGHVSVAETPAPSIQPNMALVKVEFSCISTGTEMSSIHLSGLPLWKRALMQPHHVKKVLAHAAQSGWKRTYDMVQGTLESGLPTGYSAAGTVIDVGSEILDISIGERVACAGAQYANHAEWIVVPRNLLTPIPEGVPLREASTVTLGAIALQGVRRAQPTLGESFVVLGLGILGQLTIQILKTNGCRVIACDLDPSRVQLAQQLGADVAVVPSEGQTVDQVLRLTRGMGADGVIITASGRSNEIIAQAFQMCRKKGRVVLVGDVGLDIRRNDIYAKELDFFISTSYGPGRYDDQYEEGGVDYPLAYVRWTENRNMQEYLSLLAERKVDVESLISGTYPISEAEIAYQRLKEEASKPLSLLLSYPEMDGLPNATLHNPAAVPAKQGQIRLGVIGAGGFAKVMHLPNLKKLHYQFYLQTIASRSSHNAYAVAKQFSAKSATTDFNQVLDDQEIDAVLIATRHHLHQPIALQALQSGKHVLLEKPLAMTLEQLQELQDYFQHNDSEQIQTPILLTGFNRRFSPHIQWILSKLKNRQHPMVINYQMNAGFLPSDHWVHGNEGGGRNIGEACHIYDLFTCLTNSPVRDVVARALRAEQGYYRRDDNFTAVFSFEDGSVANLTYTAAGHKNYPKEHMQIFCEGKVLTLEDYKISVLTGDKKDRYATQNVEKGQFEELKAFANGIHGSSWPIPLWQQIQATQMAFWVQQQLVI